MSANKSAYRVTGVGAAGAADGAAGGAADNSLVQDISLKEKIGYGLGDFASQLLFAAASTFLSFFYTDVIGIAAAAVGTLLFIARVLDAFADIGIGALIDKTKSKHGKARPWLLWMAAPFAASGLLLFTVPDAGPVVTMIYIYVTYLLMNFIYSAINVPYGVLNSLMTQDGYQRSVLNIFRMVLAVCGAILVTYFTKPLVNAFGGGKIGWIWTFAIFGLLGMLIFLFTFATTKERVKPSVVQKEIPFNRGLKALFRNKYWALLLMFAIVFFANNAMGSTMNVYYAQYMLHNVDLVGILGLANLIPLLVAYFLLAPVIKRFGKRNAALAGSVILIAGSLVMALNPEDLRFVIAGLVIKAVGTAPIMGTFFAMLADTVEYGEWKTGMRTEGLVYSAGSFGTKAGSGFGAALVGWGLAIGGYVGGQASLSAAAMTSIQMLFIYVPILLSVLQVVILWPYRLDKQYNQIVKDLQTVRTDF